MIESSIVPSRRTAFAGIVAIAAGLVCFLLFTGRAFLDLAATVAGGGARLQLLSAVLGGGGIAGSLLAARRFDLGHFSPALGNAFRACGVAAALALVAQAWWVFLLTAGAVGLSLGWVVVTLAVGLRSILGTARLGRYIGMAIGVAYALCSLPWIFAASPWTQLLLAGAAAVIGALAAPWLWPRSPSQSSSPDYAPRVSLLWVAIFLALVWLDTVIFQVVLHTPALKAGGWSGVWKLGGNSGVCLVAALLAGRALDHGWLGRLQVVAFALLAGAVVFLDEKWRIFLLAQVGYAAGVSIYSTALVYYAARSGRPLLVGLLVAVAGWGGCILGPGVVQERAQVPYAFLGAAGAVIAVALGLRTWWRRPTAGIAGAATPEPNEPVAGSLR
jgi:cytochrome c oxidase cbb3-type subunit 2